MGAPRRRFPGGSVGSFFVVRPDREENGDSGVCESFLTEIEALKIAQEWANRGNETVYVTKYVNHCTPEEPDA